MHLNHLRPVFFRLPNSEDIHSGWCHLQKRQTGSGWLDIWALTDDMRRYAHSIMGSNLELGLRLNSLQGDDNGLALIPSAVPALLIGERVSFGRECDLFPSDFIEQGEKGVVGRRDRNTGAVEVFLEFMHHNEALLLIPHHCDSEVLQCIERHTDSFTAQSFVSLDDFEVA